MRLGGERRPFDDRRSAGRELAAVVRERMPHGDGLVLALPRGGVPVAAEVAAALGAPLDVLVVRKLGVPHSPELAMGAIASVAGRIESTRNDRVLHDAFERGAESALAAVTAAEERELQRRLRAYRGERPPLDVAGRTVVLVDDGIATGATARAAVAAARAAGAGRVVVAVPVSLGDAAGATGADDVIDLWRPGFFSVGQAYLDFRQTTDDEVRSLLGVPGPAGDGTEGEPAP
ncbi:phosphoribosyltransferase family protein [Herbiconiux sp. SYSU D00978]|uniref:phosphoribosyltransferase family protein n=1 Tax=Herbiconiux sp. SYSU D00978 TaxID=2812562 RepID=UPI001A967CCA|nr:phosphoribosyltransferase family protein [Herbiconiux sp. SYSU D00978]